MYQTREQGWRSGESTRLPPMWPGFDSRSRRHMWVEFVVGSCPCSEGFSPGAPVFLPPQKLTFPKFQFDLETVERRATTWIPLKSPFIFFYFYFKLSLKEVQYEALKSVV